MPSRHVAWRAKLVSLAARPAARFHPNQIKVPNDDRSLPAKAPALLYRCRLKFHMLHRALEMYRIGNTENASPIPLKRMERCDHAKSSFFFGCGSLLGRWPWILASEWVPTPGSSSTYRTRSRHHNIALMRSFGASRSEVAIDVGPEEVQRSVRAAGIDVEVFEVIAHDELTCV